MLFNLNGGLNIFTVVTYLTYKNMNLSKFKFSINKGHHDDKKKTK